MDENFDKELMEVMGDRIIQEKPPVAKYEPAEGKGEATYDVWGMMKMPLLFTALVGFLAWTAHVGLVDPIVAIPGMCVCSVCLGWNVKRG